MLAGLQDRRPVEQPVAIVVAHPDDETIAAGGSMHLLRNLLLVHVTDGAPRRLGDAARAGFDSPEAYAAAREAELAEALAYSGAAPVRVLLGVPDQDASLRIPEIADRLRALFQAHGITAVLTHAYEGGHPDHDATALAVRLSAHCDILEFAGYHAGGGAMQTGTFLPATEPELAVDLTLADQGRKRAMMDCFRTQRAVLARFDPARERFRPAPAHDFTQAPHPGLLNYERWGWMNGEEWRRLASAAMGHKCAA